MSNPIINITSHPRSLIQITNNFATVSTTTKENVNTTTNTNNTNQINNTADFGITIQINNNTTRMWIEKWNGKSNVDPLALMLTLPPVSEQRY